MVFFIIIAYINGFLSFLFTKVAKTSFQNIYVVL